MKRQRSFRSFFLGGFECSTHCRPDGTRLDLIAFTCHDSFCDWTIVDCSPGYTGLPRWSAVAPDREAGALRFFLRAPLILAARNTGMQVIWDLFHYGWPDGLDIFSPRFIDRFSSFAEGCGAADRFRDKRCAVVCGCQ